MYEWEKMQQIFFSCTKALRNQAKYYKDDKLVDVSADDLMNEAKPYFIYPGLAFILKSQLIRF